MIDIAQILSELLDQLIDRLTELCCQWWVIATVIGLAILYIIIKGMTR